MKSSIPYLNRSLTSPCQDKLKLFCRDRINITVQALFTKIQIQLTGSLYVQQHIKRRGTNNTTNKQRLQKQVRKNYQRNHKPKLLSV